MFLIKSKLFLKRKPLELKKHENIPLLEDFFFSSICPQTFKTYFYCNKSLVEISQGSLCHSMKIRVITKLLQEKVDVIFFKINEFGIKNFGGESGTCSLEKVLKLHESPLKVLKSDIFLINLQSPMSYLCFCLQFFLNFREISRRFISNKMIS